jgi:flagellar protein FlaG
MSVASVGYNPVSSQPSDARVTLKRSGSAQKSETKVNPQVSQSAADLQRVFNRKLQFVVDQNSNQVLVKVIDKNTDKVIKVLPPEELQRLHRNIKNAIGLLFNEMA